MSPDAEESIRCSVSGCSCLCFKPGSSKFRSCDRCGHGWVVHALEKLQAQPSSSCGPVEVALPGLVFDLSSLVLYGAQAVPVRLKILLDRLYSVLTPEQVGHILHALGWSLGDYVRGYMLQSPGGKVLDRWTMVTPEEELLILNQFLRFGETRPIVEMMTLQCLAAVNCLSDPQLRPAPKSRQSNISTFIERHRGTPGKFRNSRDDSHLVAGICRFEKSRVTDGNETIHRFENSPSGLSLLLPFHFPSSAFQCLLPATKDLVPPTKQTQCLQKPGETKLSQRHRQDGDGDAQENGPVAQQTKAEQALKIKVDPDKLISAQSRWQPDPRIPSDEELGLNVGGAKQENTSSPSPFSNSSFISMSSSGHPSISSSSSSPPKNFQKLRGSSPSLFHPLPSFSSSFLCPIPASSFSSSLPPLPSSSSSLHPLQSSPCSLPSPSSAGGRKGRVCCGVCGKSFYDKGTLKIHYNAVHLKIKHCCTVAGCTMVFSSLRSRNRHSANPNPRLHTGSGRDAHIQRNTQPEAHTREKEISRALWQPDEDTHTLVHVHNFRNGSNCYSNHHHGSRDMSSDSSLASPHPPPLVNSQNFTRTDSSCRSHLHPHVPPHPPTHVQALSASSVGSTSLVSAPSGEKNKPCLHPIGLNTSHTAPAPLPDHAPIATTHCNEPYGCTEGKQEEIANQLQQWESGDSIPKKKPRKSSMPLKIERVESEGRRHVEGEEC
ncbi:unnamed protein product [Pleuronectes platessa]|uniref:C2H2-type domain-containing protein n=1 Tax=Pleuronectes platessa TaxID=8262 RepID=A0A9N7VLG9_PLEPL|nr:unnamed protein product [Pleuronectes platessa]